MHRVTKSCYPAAFFSDTNRKTGRSVAERRGCHGQFSLNLNPIKCLFAVLSPSCAACRVSTLGCWYFFSTLYVYMLMAGFDHAQWLWVSNMQCLAASFMSNLERSLLLTCIGFLLSFLLFKVSTWILNLDGIWKKSANSGWFGIVFWDLDRDRWKIIFYH